MEEGPVRHTLGYTVIADFVADIERAIDSSGIVLSSKIEKYFGPAEKSVYVTSHLTMIDSSLLEVAIFAIESAATLAIVKYRFHYMDSKGQTVFRYDNAPHHPELLSFPHHKHTPNRTTASDMPSLDGVLSEISAAILTRHL